MSYSSTLIRTYRSEIWTVSLQSSGGSMALAYLANSGVSMGVVIKLWEAQSVTYSSLTSAVRNALQNKIWPVYDDDLVGEAGGQLLYTIAITFPKDYQPPPDAYTAAYRNGSALDTLHERLNLKRDQIKQDMVENREKREKAKQDKENKEEAEETSGIDSLLGAAIERATGSIAGAIGVVKERTEMAKQNVLSRKIVATPKNLGGMHGVIPDKQNQALRDDKGPDVTGAILGLLGLGDD